MILGSICLTVVLLKFTSRGRPSLLSLARRALLPYVVRNQIPDEGRTCQSSEGDFVDAMEELGPDNGDGHLEEGDAYDSSELIDDL